MSDHRLRQGHHEPRNLWEYPADTPPESKSGHCAGQVFDPDLAAEIVHAVNTMRSGQVADAVNAIERIRYIHRPVHGGPANAPTCRACRTAAWPCPTRRAVDGSDDE